jgi:hypothetical protein
MRQVGVLFLKQGDNQNSIDGNFRRRLSPHGHTRSDIIASPRRLPYWRRPCLTPQR